MLGIRIRALAAVAALVAVTALAAGCEKDEPDLSAATTTGATTTAPVAGSPAAIAGDWTGTLTQQGLEPFQVAVRMEADGTGRVAYTGIGCGGTWALGPISRSNPPQFHWRETIRKGAGGNCKGTGDVTLIPQPDGTLSYTFTGGGVTSHGIISRTDPSGLAPIFQAAGLQPPS